MNDALIITVIVLAGVAVAIIVATTLIRFLRLRRERRQARLAAGPRRELLAFAAEPDASGADRLAAMPQRQWQHIEPAALALLGKLRGDGYQALAQVFDRRGIAEEAIRQTRSRSPVVRARHAELLGALRHGPAAPDLARLLRDRDVEVVVVAIRALGHVGDPRAAPALLDTLAGDRSVPAHLVAQSLTQLGPDAVPALMDALAAPAATERLTAVQAMGMLGDPRPSRAVAGVIAADPDLAVRVAAARTLGELGARVGLEPLVAALAPRSPPDLRAAAATALGALGAPTAAPALGALLNDPIYQVAHAAARALRRLGGPGLNELTGAAAGPSEWTAAHAREALAMAALANPARTARPSPLEV
ncbi:HEAT repeat domain-containing protein [Pilimelia columellifera]|uniref:HEAT repeat domain-containing protein n=1 Tax=Pilimelia columellifera subsp. columellifera TaxID=706583 RepID=A0ABN3NNR4_9ACTN